MSASSPLDQVNARPLEGDEEEEGEEEEEDEDDELEDDDDYYYYSFDDAADVAGRNNNNDDPENEQISSLTDVEAEQVLADAVQQLMEQAQQLQGAQQLSQSSAKLLLHHQSWNIPKALSSLSAPSSSLRPKSSSSVLAAVAASSRQCDVCAASYTTESFSSLNCGHSFCKSCWETYFENLINQGASTRKDISM